MAQGEEVLNGMRVPELREYIETVKADPSVAERNLSLVARWMGGPRAQLTHEGQTFHIGAEGEPSAMWLLLASLAACDVEVVATTATILGVELKGLEIETEGHFNVQRLLGIEEAPGPGYDQIAYTVRVRAPGATEEQVAQLKAMCERGSPVGDSLTRRIPLKLEVETRR
ncbi:MAG: OsmC family protein [Thermoplasmata archaeon]